jgi:hypothetical protein
MRVTSAKAKVTEFKPKALKIAEHLGTSVDMGLLEEAIVVTFDLEHHDEPVVSCVMH